ncbi:putative zinc-binding metallopeptidase [Flavobacterium sp. JLP]|uniref:zinc-binding metallopeptidase n=1 Tax=unclassified Flavobacterium TaxID=196869 RepID=UPI000493927E|nr:MULTISPECIES: putative zinc-binding metallopeptidase [unclassified Flavobacterium]MBF4491079.1 putative zinc-binding metallopeptidase [Flavobacterium sp. MR2016-29]MBF4505192.1 putative zinc-binding metallopeptidase [Flavobacterium sp. JLP]
MKILKQYRVIMFAAGVLIFGACSHEDQPGESQLDYSQPQKTALDNWISTNYLVPYNINAQYKWNQNTVDNNRFLFPPMISSVQPALDVVKQIWLDSYSKVGGADFVKKIAPREIVLVGGVNSNTNGTRTLGIADSGQRITLFEVDYLDKTNRANVTEFIHTIQHEYVHILNQNKPFDEQAWQKISPGDYTGTWHLEKLEDSRNLGFITNYARNNIIEDFAETASTILTSSKAEYAAILASISDEEGRAKLKQKEAMVVKYYKDAFNIDFYALRDEAEKNTNNVINN